ncbi:hypothetical protein PVAG01_04560 [Phlyctema vagabunda]|uniref:Cobalamin-independent methionine synthase MetE C-terminal/archaeal domain-containing protein n=1 Tax=Phlyctema vagabunda TaxID=108571 RepID=A0ABR4PHU5_9HELO
MSTTINHQRPPFRAEQLGSLLRPDALLQARYAVDKNEGTQAELAAIEDASIKEIVKTQLDLGYHGVSDGEYRRHMFWGSFFTGLEGFSEIKNPDMEIFRSYVPDVAGFLETKHKPAETDVCTGKIKHVGSTYVDQWNYLKALLPADKVHEAKLTMAAPEWYHLRYKTGRAYPKEVYANDAEYFADIAKAYRAELKILYDAGLRNIQIDDPNLAYFCSEKMLQGFKDDKESSDDLFKSYIKLYNDCLSERPSDLHVGIHLCRGNFVEGRHFSEGGYDAIATALFRELNADTYFLEYDTERAGGFEPLKELPAHKNVILGLITSKFPALENIDEMKKKVFQAAELVAEGAGVTKEDALKRMGVSPQCGFASHADGNNVNREDMVKKLALVRQLADEIWPGEP